MKPFTLRVCSISLTANCECYVNMAMSPSCALVSLLFIYLYSTCFIGISLSFPRRSRCNMYQSTIQAKGVFSEGNLDEIESLNFSHRPGLARPRRKKFFASRVLYYPNSTRYLHLPRLILSGDVELNPGMTGQPKLHCLKNLKMAHLNIRSLRNRSHFIQVKNLVSENDFDILTLSETWLNGSVDNSEISIPGYTIKRLDRQNKTGGGICVFIKEIYKVKQLSKLSSISSGGFHQLWLSIQINKYKSFIVCTAYRPPDCPLDCFDQELSESLISALTPGKDIFILGDLNCNVLDISDGNARALLDFCSTFNLTQVIKQPTRRTDLSETLIDVIIVTNKYLVKTSGVRPVTISDHDLVFITLNLKRRRLKPVYVIRRSYKHYDAGAFARDIAEAPWSVVESFDDVDEKLDAFHLLFDPTLDQHAPIRRVKLRTRPNPFVTDEIKSLMKTRDNWRKQASRTNRGHHLEI